MDLYAFIDDGSKNPSFKTLKNALLSPSDISEMCNSDDFDGTLTIPEGVKVLMNRDDGVSLTVDRLIIPASVRQISPEVLVKLNLKEISVTEGNSTYFSVDGILFSRNNPDIKILAFYPTRKEGSHYSVPEGTDVIEKMAFKNNLFLRRVDLPKSTRIICDEAFSGAANLSEINIGRGNFSAGKGVFDGTALTDIPVGYPASDPWD